MSKHKPPYEVGYGKPPESGQFVKGQSGNSKGRPKGSKNLAKIVQRESRQPVRLNGPHGARTVSKAEATLMQIGNKAAQGDPRASKEFLGLIQWSEQNTDSETAPLAPHEMDQQVLQTLRRRMESADGKTTTTDTPVSVEESK